MRIQMLLQPQKPDSMLEGLSFLFSLLFFGAWKRKSYENKWGKESRDKEVNGKRQLGK